jgi:hypothetical protein
LASLTHKEIRKKRGGGHWFICTGVERTEQYPFNVASQWEDLMNKNPNFGGKEDGGSQ